MTTTKTSYEYHGTFNDDREGIENKTLTTFIMGYDTYLSGETHFEKLLRITPLSEWTQEDRDHLEYLKSRKSYAVWACKEEHGDKVYKWVKSRSDMKNVQYRSMNSIKKHIGNNVHIHIYAVGDNHPSVTAE